MADSIQSWIASYLIAIAEDHGANIASVPYHQKPKKVQLTEVNKLSYIPNYINFKLERHISG
jgi:hypothetical protein